MSLSSTWEATCPCVDTIWGIGKRGIDAKAKASDIRAITRRVVGTTHVLCPLSRASLEAAVGLWRTFCSNDLLRSSLTHGWEGGYVGGGRERREGGMGESGRGTLTFCFEIREVGDATRSPS